LLALVGDAIDMSDTYVQCDAQKWEDPEIVVQWHCLGQRG